MQYRFPVYSFIYCRCPAAGGRHKSKSQHACTNHACYFFIERLCDLFLHSWDGMYMLCLDTQVSGCAQSCHKNFTFGQIPCHIISLFESPSFALITEPALSDFRQCHPLPPPLRSIHKLPAVAGSLRTRKRVRSQIQWKRMVVSCWVAPDESQCIHLVSHDDSQCSQLVARRCPGCRRFLRRVTAIRVAVLRCPGVG